MNRHKLVTRLASGTAAAALAFGAVACDLEDDGAMDPGQEAPEGEAEFEGEADVEDDGLDDDFDEDGDLGDDF